MTSFQALSSITNSLNQPLLTSDEIQSGSASLFPVNNVLHFAMPKNKPSKTAKKIADQNTHTPTILEPSLAEVMI
jgi:hypothetical protein